MANNPSPPPAPLPQAGLALVRSVLSGDTLLLTAPNPSYLSHAYIFHLTDVVAPRLGNTRTATADEPGAFDSKEFLRSMLVGKIVEFKVVRQSNNKYFGIITLDHNTPKAVNVNIEVVKNGHGTSKAKKTGDASVDSYCESLEEAEALARNSELGVHGSSARVRTPQQAGEQFTLAELAKETEGKKIKVIIQYCFDGGRYKVEEIGTWRNFTVQLAGISCPRQDAEGGPQSKFFVDLRLLNRCLDITIIGADKNGSVAVAKIHHPKGNIALEVLKSGLGNVSEWSARFLEVVEVAELRRTETAAKAARVGIWRGYVKPVVDGVSEAHGTVVEVVTGDTCTILMGGETYTSDEKLLKVSLASVRSPRMGGRGPDRVDEPYAFECKDRLRQLLVGKQVKVKVDYVRDIPAGENTIKRKYATISVGKRADVGEVLITEGLASLQFHRDGEVRSSRYDELSAAEAEARKAKKNLHSGKDAGVRKRTVEVKIMSCTNGGVMTGKMWVGGGEKKTNFSKVLLDNGLATIDFRDVEGSDAEILRSMETAKAAKLKIYSIVKEEPVVVVKKEGGIDEEVKTVKVSEITNGNRFFVTADPDLSEKVVARMAEFKETNGLQAGPVEFRKNKLVACMFDDGKGKEWYRAKVLEKKGDGARVLYVDHGNVASVSVRDCRMLDPGIETIPFAASECELALIKSRGLEHDEGIDAARMLSKLTWGKELTARIHGKDVDGGSGLSITLYNVDDAESINSKIVKAGLARIIGDRALMYFKRETQESAGTLHDDLKEVQEEARKGRVGIWVYGDVGEDDDESARY
ncbi:hypothetical protein TrRE_jg11487 [Triparma retinervis]|uniref:Uncharacterized protein n=1 Tax=Triparma retinervis TaxID=2557542 RepID=A0A9W7DKI2_9STRA|nr:hypothetical protein TrRE_jg11487 [Triparma retinervis]